MVRKGGFFEGKVAELGVEEERESGVRGGEGEVGGEDERGEARGAEEAEAGF